MLRCDKADTAIAVRKTVLADLYAQQMSSGTGATKRMKLKPS